MTWPGLTKDVERLVCQMTKKKNMHKKYGKLPPKTTESEIVFLIHGQYKSCGSIYNEDTIQTTLSAYIHNHRFINAPLAVSKLLNPQMSQNHPSRICFMTPDWNVTRDPIYCL
jgi:hypothetical protein